LTLAAVDNPGMTLQPVDDMAAEMAHHTGQTHTAAVDCTAALNIQTITAQFHLNKTLERPYSKFTAISKILYFS